MLTSNFWLINMISYLSTRLRFTIRFWNFAEWVDLFLHMSLVNEWLLFNAKWFFCWLYHGSNKFDFAEMMMMMMSMLCHINTWSWIYLILRADRTTLNVNSEQTSLSSYTLVLHAERRSIIVLRWFRPTIDLNYDLPFGKWANYSHELGKSTANTHTKSN